MKQFAHRFSVSGAFVLGCVAATVAREQAVSPAVASGPGESAGTGARPGLQTWEYHCEYGTFTKSAWVKQLNDLGAQGWRLVTDVCFERPR